MKGKKLNIIILWIMILSVFTTVGCSQRAVEKPNIVLIMIDDAGWGDLTSNGNPWVTTPNIDQIRKDGLTVNRFYVSPLCAPTRASLLTGRYHLRTGTASVTGGLETMRTEEITVAEILRDAGYATGIFGKWHNGAHYPENAMGQGFSEFTGFSAGHWTNYFDTKLQHNNEMVDTKGYITDVLTDAALGFIEKNKSKPFLCYIPYNAPHGPFQVPDKYYDSYKNVDISNQDKAIYGMIDNLDENIGRVMDKLDQLKLTNNTIVVFLSDNGPNSDRYNGNMKGKKGSVNEGGVRVPFFITWPGHIKKGSEIDKIAAHIDVLPTLLDLIGVKFPKEIQFDGKSLVPLIQDKNAEWAERNIFSHTYRNKKLQPAPGAIRNSKYRFIVDEKGNELYDMELDPEQKVNIALSEPKLLKDFEFQYKNWFKDVTEKGIRSEITKIGYDQSPVTELFTPDVSFKKGVVYNSGNGYAHDWLIGWNNTNDKADWTIEVVQDGMFQIELKYNSSDSFVGQAIKVIVDNQVLSKKLDKSYLGKVIPSPDRVQRIEAYEKDWGLFNLGTLELKKGIHQLSIQTEGRTMVEKLELKSLLITKH
jgi:arylsulfatase A